MDLDEFMHARNADMPGLLAAVKATIGLARGDALIVVGSLVEGLGTIKSDVDLILITARDGQTLPPRPSVTLVVGRCLIDVRIMRVAELADLLARFETWSRLAWDVVHAVTFTLDERTLLHRFVNPFVVAGADAAVLQRRPQRDALARLKLHVARQMSRTIQVDMVGYRDTGDYRSLVFAAQEVLGHAVDALAAGHHLTNPLIKWRSRMLDAVPHDWEASLSMRPSGLTAGECVWRLHRAPVSAGKRAALGHALRVTTFARAIYLWAEHRLVLPRAASPKRRLDRRRQRSAGASGERLPFLDLDVDLIVREGGAAVARLNEFEQPVELSARESVLIPLFDGTTTLRDAAAVASPRGRVDVGLRELARLAARLDGAQLTARS